MTPMGQKAIKRVQPTEAAATKATGWAVYGFVCFRTRSWKFKVTALTWLMSGEAVLVRRGCFLPVSSFGQLLPFSSIIWVPGLS